MKNFLLGLVSILVAFLVLAVGGEIVTRLVYLMPEPVAPDRVIGVMTLDPELGWVATANYLFDGQLVDAGGNAYPANIRSNSAGYRMYGNPQEEGRKKVLFLGDSFTQAMHVSNENTYYGILGRDLDLEVFAFGTEAYGTLQEYMLLDRIIDGIKPDVVVLQFCPNDFINNHYALELESVSNNNGLRRPYFQDGNIVYRTPSRVAALREFAASYSHFLYWILTRIDMVKAAPANASLDDSSEQLIVKEGLSYPYFQESVQITQQLLKKFRDRVPATTPVYIFSSHNAEPYHAQLQRALEGSGMIFIDGTGQAVIDAQKQGITAVAGDHSHWNNAGHQIVADVLKRYFIENGQFTRAADSPAP